MSKKMIRIPAMDMVAGDEMVTGGTVIKLLTVWKEENNVWFTFKMSACDGRTYEHKCKLMMHEHAHILR